ncbi:hypothetical protein A3758_13360 [Oleiphilus sp. HI0118]|nr:hypothetical protein A3758_13360 [Oleiphilus sp. HI0118]
MLLMIACICVQGCSDEVGAQSQANPEKREKIFKLYGGTEQPFEAIDSPYVLMNYWASWCKPCVKEIPELNALDKHPSAAVYAFNFDRLEGEKLLAEANKFGLDLPMLLNEPAPLFGEDSPAALPATLVVNTQTGEQQWLMGAQTKRKILSALGL